MKVLVQIGYNRMVFDVPDKDLAYISKILMKGFEARESYNQDEVVEALKVPESFIYEDRDSSKNELKVLREDTVILTNAQYREMREKVDAYNDAKEAAKRVPVSAEG
jgi:ferredoxin